MRVGSIIAGSTRHLVSISLQALLMAAIVAGLAFAAATVAGSAPDGYTIALGYTGDSVLNSLSDIAMMAFGFLAARRLPLWGSVALLIALELLPLVAIRDNLTLNILMLVSPSDAIRTWQAGA